MKQSRFYISLYIIIPFIITGLTILACIISFRLTKYSLAQGSDPAQPVFWFIIAIAILTFVIGFALVRFILRPVEQFVEKAKKLASISGDAPGKKKEWSVDKIGQN
jgi:methyl-accepting chemotaxis protein